MPLKKSETMRDMINIAKGTNTKDEVHTITVTINSKADEGQRAAIRKAINKMENGLVNKYKVLKVNHKFTIR